MSLQATRTCRRSTLRRELVLVLLYDGQELLGYGLIGGYRLIGLGDHVQGEFPIPGGNRAYLKPGGSRLADQVGQGGIQPTQHIGLRGSSRRLFMWRAAEGKDTDQAQGQENDSGG